MSCFNPKIKEYPKRISVIIPPLNLNDGTFIFPARKVVSPHSRKMFPDEIIPPGSLVLTPHTPRGDENPCDILIEKISQDIKKRQIEQSE